MYITIESCLNKLSLSEIEIINNDRFIPLYPIGIKLARTNYRHELKERFIVQDGNYTIYAGLIFNSVLKALERHQGTIIYSKIIKK